MLGVGSWENVRSQNGIKMWRIAESIVCQVRHVVSTMDINVGTLVAVALGGLMTWVATYLADHRRFSHDRRERLRIAYSNWLADQEMTIISTRTLQVLVERSIDGRDEQAVAEAGLKELTGSLRDLLKTLHELLTLEDLPQLREIVLLTAKTTRGMYPHIIDHLVALRQVARLTERIEKAEADSRDVSPSAEGYETLRNGLGELKEWLKENRKVLIGRAATEREATSQILDMISKLVENLTALLPSRFRFFQRRKMKKIWEGVRARGEAAQVGIGAPNPAAPADG